MEKKQLHKCIRCGNLAIFKLKNEIEIEEDLYDEDNQYATFGYNSYYIFLCTSCNRVSIFGYFFTNPVEEKISELDLIYPEVKNITNYLPEEIKKIYIEAQKIQNISATSFAILIRKSLEQICKEQQARGTNLSEMIKDLSIKNVLPKKMNELANIVRYIGNVSAHNVSQIDFWDVELLGQLFNFICDYIYVIDNKIEMIKRKWKINNGL